VEPVNRDTQGTSNRSPWAARRLYRAAKTNHHVSSPPSSRSAIAYAQIVTVTLEMTKLARRGQSRAATAKAPEMRPNQNAWCMWNRYQADASSRGATRS